MLPSRSRPVDPVTDELSRTPAGEPGGHTGFVHDTGFYCSDEELLELVVPFVEGGMADGDPTFVSLPGPELRLVRSTVGDRPGLTFLDAADQYSRPTATIRRYRKLLGDEVASGARRVRAVGPAPHPGVGAPWEMWARYEAVINHAFHDLPLWGLCPYDTRCTPGDVLADVERTHPNVATGRGGRSANPRYEDPALFLASRQVPPDPLAVRAPDAELVDPTPGAARRAVAEVGSRSLVAPAAVDDLVLACSEVVTNATLHGRPPVVLRAWAAPERVVVSVTDRGRGPADPLVGLLPTDDRTLGGFGLWLVHELCSQVALTRTDGSFTVRLVVGEPHRAS